MEIPDNIRTKKHNNIVDDISLNQIININPLIVVDVGCGDGYYCKLIKHNIPKCKVIGIEKHKPYIKKFALTSIYDEIINNDIIDEIQNITGDLIIFGDVLEHLVKDDMEQVLKTAVQNFKFVLINSPYGYQPQPHPIESELHLCGITSEDLNIYNVIEYNEYTKPGHMFNCLIKGYKNN
jgi:tRNA1(Val) A37 N6-methylase TrmN6